MEAVVNSCCGITSVARKEPQLGAAMFEEFERVSSGGIGLRRGRLSLIEEDEEDWIAFTTVCYK